ncbi:hypothetical protein T439DRAFT_325754 [Meredithblackwellia eburnea MCA 4105]
MFSRSTRFFFRQKSSFNSFRTASSSKRQFFWSATAPVIPTFPATSVPSTAPTLLVPLLASLLYSSEEEEPIVNPPWEPRSLSAVGKGIGVFPTRDLAAGTLLIAERPLCVWPQGLSEEQAQNLFDNMAELEQKKFMALDAGNGKQMGLGEVRGRRATNGFEVHLPGRGGGKAVGMVFEKIARVNHSCLPNTSQAMNFQTLRMELYTLTPLSPFTEITIEYLPSLILQPYSERQASLQKHFGIDRCLCELCTASVDVRVKSDERRKELAKLGKELATGMGGREEGLKRLERVRVLLSEEGYNGLPEFEDSGATNAYAVYASMWARKQRDGM